MRLNETAAPVNKISWGEARNQSYTYISYDIEIDSETTKSDTYISLYNSVYQEGG